jgi:hypothetical protein
MTGEISGAYLKGEPKADAFYTFVTVDSIRDQAY